MPAAGEQEQGVREQEKSTRKAFLSELKAGCCGGAGGMKAKCNCRFFVVPINRASGLARNDKCLQSGANESRNVVAQRKKPANHKATRWIFYKRVLG